MMMEEIIKNEDFGIPNAEYSDNPFTRYAARGVVYNPDDHRISVVVITKMNLYKLPGGGVEGEENPEETFEREVLEEAGCKIKNIRKIGTVLEERSSVDFKQVSHVFVADLLEDIGKNNPTEEEIAGGLKTKWMDIDEALEIFEANKDKITGETEEDVYVAKFMAERDIRILKIFKEQHENVLQS